MRKAEKQEVLKMPTIATCWEEYPGGIEIKKIEYGIDDYCICATQTMTESPRVHRVKIKYTREESEPYIEVDGFKIFMNMCIKCA